MVGSPSLRRGSSTAIVSQHESAGRGRDGDLRPGPHPAQQPAAADPRGGRPVATSCATGTTSWSPRRAAASCAGGARPSRRSRSPLADAHAEIAPGEGPLTLRSVSNAAPLPGEDPEDALRRRLAETADKEIWNGATLVGPHRDDLAFDLDGRDLSGFASRGQQRTAILALKLAELDLLTGDRRARTAAAARRRVQRARPPAPRPPGAPDRRAAAGLRDHHRPGRPRPGARAGRTAWQVTPGRLERMSGDAPADASPRGPAARCRGAPGHRGSSSTDASRAQTWELLVADLVPPAAGRCHVLEVRPPALVVSAAGRGHRPGAAAARARCCWMPSRRSRRARAWPS